VRDLNRIINNVPRTYCNHGRLKRSFDRRTGVRRAPFDAQEGVRGGVVVLLLVGLASPLNTLARSTQPATVRASLTAGTTGVTNTVTITPESISLSSVFDANGQVSAGGKPLANATVAFHMGDVILGSAKTDQLGHYAISVPAGAYYFPAALNGATVYTVVEPVNSSFISAPSAATDVAVDQAPLYTIIVVIIAAAVAVVLYLFVRRIIFMLLLG